jgi:hypothetical protein
VSTIFGHLEQFAEDGCDTVDIIPPNASEPIRVCPQDTTLLSVDEYPIGTRVVFPGSESHLEAVMLAILAAGDKLFYVQRCCD